MAEDALKPEQAGDPRLEPRPVESRGLSSEPMRPQVAHEARNSGPWLVVGVATLMGLMVFAWLAGHRGARHSTSEPPASVSAASPITAPAAPPELAAIAAQSVVPAIAPPTAVAPTPQPTAAPSLPPPPASTPVETGRTPVLVVDFSPPEAAKPSVSDGSKAPSSAGAPTQGLNADERFLARIEGGPEPARASATLLHNQATLIPQGTTIPAVLETALNSDLPGFARAVVSRDVRGFDASMVLVPRGSRVIGEYRSAVSQGQRRAFVIWTRVIRPDGVSIMIGSGGGDTLGRAGLAGQVDTHFLERFSGAVLLTALNAGATAAAGVPSTEVVVGSAGAGATSGLAAPFAAFAPADIPPTIKVAQGTPVLIFVQRDLDFTAIEGGGK
jgi:type IV secretion system protein VirB10